MSLPKIQLGVASLHAKRDLSANFIFMTLQEIETAVLRLPKKARRHLADKLLASLAAPLASAKPDRILAEAIRRDAELESGEVRPLTEQAFLGRGSVRVAAKRSPASAHGQIPYFAARKLLPAFRAAKLQGGRDSTIGISEDRDRPIR